MFDGLTRIRYRVQFFDIPSLLYSFHKNGRVRTYLMDNVSLQPIVFRQGLTKYTSIKTSAFEFDKILVLRVTNLSLLQCRYTVR